MPSIVALRPHRQGKCHATPYIMESDHLIPPHLPAAVPAAKTSHSWRACSCSTQCGQSQTPAGTALSAGSRHPMCHPSRQLSHSSIVPLSPALLHTRHGCDAGTVVSVGSTVVPMLGLWHGAQFSVCSLNTVLSASSSTMRPLASTWCTLYAPLDTDTSVMSAGCRWR
jgi:hypothetical protein